MERLASDSHSKTGSRPPRIEWQMAGTSPSDPVSLCSSPTSQLTATTEDTIPRTLQNERLDWTFEFARMLPVDVPLPQVFRRKLETGVDNGDCLPGCFAAILECFHQGYISSANLKPAAKDMRTSVCQWIKDHWETYPVFNDSMKVHEIIRMLHDLGIPASERVVRGEWGDDPSAQLVKYNELCDHLYFSDAEMLLFSCMMWELRRLPVLFRVFRVEEDASQASGWKGVHSTTTPEPATLRAVTGSDKALVIDVAHVGMLDGWGAHYKLLIHGSIFGLTACRSQPVVALTPRSPSPSVAPTHNPRRRRLVRHPDAAANAAQHATAKRIRTEHDAFLTI